MRRCASRMMLLLALLLCAGSALGAGVAPSAEQPQPKVVFPLTVSLEWQPGAADRLPDDLALAGCAPAAVEEQYLSDLKAGLRRAAAYLYAYSEGQMTLGKVTVFTGGEGWDKADIRVLANSAYRPAAFVGGIVGAPTGNISATAGLTRTVFYPGSILLGRAWDGRGARCGAWSQPAGWRTIGHEWGHYALFLYDEYFDTATGAEQYCTTTGLAFLEIRPQANGLADSVMAYHYSADKLWLRGDAPVPAFPRLSCAGTPQERAHGATDWQTITRFYPSVTLPDTLRADLDFESSPARDMFNVELPATARDDTSAEVRLEPLPATRLVGQSYLLRPGPNQAPQRILGQGELIPGEEAALPFWGVQQDTKDRAVVTVQDWHSGQRFGFPRDSRAAPALNLGAANLLGAAASGWRPSLTITPRVIQIGEVSEVDGLIVKVGHCGTPPKQILLAYCPAGGDCEAPVTPLGATGIFTHTFFFPFDGQYEPPAAHGYIYVRNQDTFEETIAWYQLGGGVGPIIYDGHAPLAEGEVEADPPPGQPQPDGDTRLLYSPAQRCSASGFSLPADVLGIVGTPLDVQPVVADGNGGRPWNSGLLDPDLRVRLSYSQDLLDRLQIDERQLVVLRLLAGQDTWQVVPAAGQSTALDWIAAKARPFGGQGEVYTLGYRAAQVLLPLVQR